MFQFTAINNNNILGNNHSNRAQCSDRHFRCASDDCVHISFVCDTDPDCPDGSDENPELCNKETGNILIL